MPTEEEKRLHRCCFSGHRPEKLQETVEEVQAWLQEQIHSAIAAGYTTFISGCAMGVDIWAGQAVIRMRDEQKSRTGTSDLHMIAATPWPGFANRWSPYWQQQYSDLLKHADLTVHVSNHYSRDVFQKRNEWMVNHSNRLIAYYNGASGGVRDTIDYAEEKGIEVICNKSVCSPGKQKAATEKIRYPENLIRDIGLERVFGKDEYEPLTPDQQKGLEHSVSKLTERQADMVRQRYEEQKILQDIGDLYGISRERVRQIIEKSLQKLRHPKRIAYIRDGFEKTELALKIHCAEEIKRLLSVQRKRRPQMTEEDVVKFVFQGMLGVGHLVASPEAALARLSEEYNEIEADETEPLTEKLSTDWIRLNLRSAKAKGMTNKEIAGYVFKSARMRPLSFTRQNVYNFCVKYDPGEPMKRAAEKILDENRLPSHSASYREAYHPAYRVIYRNLL